MVTNRDELRTNAKAMRLMSQPFLTDADAVLELLDERDRLAEELSKWKDVANQIVPFDPQNDAQIVDALQSWLKKYESAKAERDKESAEADRQALLCAEQMRLSEKQTKIIIAMAKMALATCGVTGRAALNEIAKIEQEK